MTTPLKLLEEIRKDFVDKHDGDPTINMICKTVIGEFKLREEQLSANEGKICKPSMQEILDEAQRRKAKHSVQYADYSLDTWTVASDLLEHRKNALLNDSSVRKVRIEYEM